MLARSVIFQVILLYFKHFRNCHVGLREGLEEELLYKIYSYLIHQSSPTFDLFYIFKFLPKKPFENEASNQKVENV